LRMAAQVLRQILFAKCWVAFMSTWQVISSVLFLFYHHLLTPKEITTKHTHRHTHMQAFSTLSRSWGSHRQTERERSWSAAQNSQTSIWQG
jgi:hypothetical protein